MMSHALQFHALINPLTARPYHAPAIQLETLRVIDCPEAFKVGAQESVTGARPDYTLRKVVQHLQRPSVLALPRERQNEGVLELLACPIMQDVLDNPVVASDGHAYSSYAIKRVFDEGMKLARVRNKTYVARSPLMGAPMENLRLIPNQAMRDLLGELGVAAPEVPAHDETLEPLEPLEAATFFDASAATERPARAGLITWAQRRRTFFARIEAVDREMQRLSDEVGTTSSLMGRATTALKMRAQQVRVDRLLALEPNDVSLLRRGMDCNLLEGNLRGAKRLLSRAVAASPAHKDVISRRALLAIMDNQTTQAWQALRELRDRLPREDDAGRETPVMSYAAMAERHMSWPALAAYGLILIREGSRHEGLGHLARAQQLFATRAVAAIIEKNR